MLELALVQWAMSKASEAGYDVMLPPDVAYTRTVMGCGFSPRGEDSTDSQIYSIPDDDLCLVGTSEIAIAGFASHDLTPEAALPVKMAAFSHCFRREAGSGGTANRGLYRLHQFSKVELFQVVHPSSSDATLEAIVQLQRAMFLELGLHFRVLDMPTMELGASAYRKYDIEAWMPCRQEHADAAEAGSWGEISSASNCTDYQARRLGIKYRPAEGGTHFAHTLNGTACAIPRIIVCLLEYGQQADGTVRIPAVLQPYLGGKSIIGKPVTEWY